MNVTICRQLVQLACSSVNSRSAIAATAPQTISPATRVSTTMVAPSAALMLFQGRTLYFGLLVRRGIAVPLSLC